MAPLRLGHIPYLNCRPFFHYLRDTGFDGEILSGVPSRLNRMLQRGEVDVSPSSSFEYARHAKDYLLLPELSISSCGPVRSVLLFSPCPPQELAGVEIAITGESATSINLLRVLLHHYYQLPHVCDKVPQRAAEDCLAAGQPTLLIGDRAMRQQHQLPQGMQVYDLGQLWYQNSGLPFVFALWILRRDRVAAHKKALSQLQQQLQQSLHQAQADLSRLLRPQEVEQTRELVQYWRTIDYHLGPQHLRGLELFFHLCQRYQLLDQQPPLEFFTSKPIRT